MKTLARILKVDQTGTDWPTTEFDWPKQPGLDLLKNFIEPNLYNDWMEHVAVAYKWDSPETITRNDLPACALDMFVDEMGGHKNLPVNVYATKIYQTFTNNMKWPHIIEPNLAVIYGTAIIFNRKVWY